MYMYKKDPGEGEIYHLETSNSILCAFFVLYKTKGGAQKIK